MDWKEDLLTNLLKCGILDLQVLEGCQYDFVDLIETLRDELGYEKFTLNDLAFAMFEHGKRDIRAWKEERIEELEDNEEELEEAETEELEALRKLEPLEDIESYHNYIDTHVYFTNNQEVYEKYCQEAIDKFNENTGYSLL